MGKAYFRIEQVLKYAYQVRQTFDYTITWGHPLHDIPDDEIVSLVHAHGLSYIPGKPPAYFGEKLRETFTGKNQVHVRQVKAEQVSPDGIVTSGAQGFGEYAGKKKTSTIKVTAPDTAEGGRCEEMDYDSDDLDLTAIEANSRRDAAIGVFAEAEIFRAQHGVNMTVRVGVNRLKPTSEKPDVQAPNNPDDCCASDIEPAEPIVLNIPDDLTAWNKAISHTAKSSMVLSPITTRLSDFVSLVDRNVRSLENPPKQTCMVAFGTHTRDNSTRAASSAHPYFVDPDRVLFYRHVSCGRELRPP